MYSKAFLFCCILLFACAGGSVKNKSSNSAMQIQIIDRKLLAVPSASGMEIIDTTTYLFGDNSPFVYIGDKSFEKFEKLPLLKHFELVDGIMPKKTKLDIEASCVVTDGNHSYVLAIGSGSDENRFSGFLVSDKRHVSSFSLEKLYDSFLEHSGLKQSDLNMEGLATDGINLYFFNRGENYVFRISTADFWRYIEDFSLPKLKVLKIKWEKEDDILTGVSGVTYSEIRNSFFFTASIENTTNWVDDGEIAGSYIGEIIFDPTFESYSIHKKPLIEIDGNMLKVKLESLVILEDGKGSVRIAAVSDSDGGESEVFNLLISQL